MSYLAIARKYRPANFDEIVGQEHVTATLRNAITRDRIHHAYLFCGARGVGKTTAARALAKSLNCEQGGPTPTPCGTCTSCTEIAAGTSPDLIEIDGASNNSVDDVRELRETVRYAPTRGKRKIYLVDEVHMLSKAAFNALLKTLEEPPPHVVFIFATTEPHKIPDTILSRVQRFDFKRIGLSDVVQRLGEIAEREGATVGETGLRMIARAGEGSMRDAQSLLDKVISFGGPEVPDTLVAETLGLIDRGLLYRMLGALVKGEAATALDVVAEVHEYGHELSRFTAEMLEVVRHATFLTLSDEVKRHVDLPADEIGQLEQITEGVATEVLTRLFDALMDTHEAVSRASRPRIVLEMALARLATPREVRPVAQLVERLEHLERRLRQSRGRTGGAAARPAGPPGRTAGPGGRMNRRARGRRGTAPRGSRHGKGQGGEVRSTPKPLPVISLPDDPSDDDRWQALVGALSQLDVPVEGLDEMVWRREGSDVVVSAPRGRRYAEVKRAVAQDAVSRLVSACFGKDAGLRVTESLSSRKAGVDSALEEAVLTDPRCQLVLRTFGAVLEDIKPLQDDGEPA